jgi:hypothetical protein
MLTWLRRIREPYRLLYIGAGTLAILFIGRTSPYLGYALWALFAVTLAALLYADFQEPTNYESLRISAGTIEYVEAGTTHLIRLGEVVRLEFVREEALFPSLDGPYLETKWLVHSGGSTPTEVMDEWPHRKLLLRAFKEHLPRFDEEAARQALKARCEGRWLCYETPHAHPSSG